MSLPLPRLTEADVKRYVPDPYYERGRDYYRGGSIFATLRRGEDLEGQCAGSAAVPYRVKVTLGERGIKRNDCTCPMGRDCKHVAALLLAWVHEPEGFGEREPLDAVLQRKSKGELMALVEEMLKRVPELERLVELPVPPEKGQKQRAPVDPETYRRELRYALRAAGDWNAAYGIAEEIASLVQIGDGFAEQGDWENARIVYQAVVDETLPGYEMLHDEGDVAAEVGRAVEGIGKCLAARADDTAARHGLLRALFDVIAWDVKAGGIGIAGPAPDLLLEHAAAEDRAEVRQWIETAVKATADLEGFNRKWQREHWGGLLLALDERDGDVEGFLRRAKGLGLYRSLFDKLVELKRFDQAVPIAHQHLSESAWERLQSADALEHAGRGPDALALAEAGLPGNRDGRLFEWLALRYEKRGDRERALVMQLSRWKDYPSLEVYETMQRLSRAMGKWDTLRPYLWAGLEQNRRFDLLARIHLAAQDWDAAWAAVDRASASSSPWGGVDVRLEVAQASEQHRPERAIAAYLQTAERLIQQLGRGNYQTAASYLRRARDLSGRINQKDAWAQALAALRDRHKNKPALKDELNKAGL